MGFDIFKVVLTLVSISITIFSLSHKEEVRDWATRWWRSAALLVKREGTLLGASLQMKGGRAVLLYGVLLAGLGLFEVMRWDEQRWLRRELISSRANESTLMDEREFWRHKYEGLDRLMALRRFETAISNNPTNDAPRR